MQVGDLVRDIEDGELGIIIANQFDNLWTVLRFSGLKDAMWEDELEVVCK